jgi:hypothetical protein
MNLKQPWNSSFRPNRRLHEQHGAKCFEHQPDSAEPGGGESRGRICPGRRLRRAVLRGRGTTSRNSPGVPVERSGHVCPTKLAGGGRISAVAPVTTRRRIGTIFAQRHSHSGKPIRSAVRADRRFGRNERLAGAVADVEGGHAAFDQPETVAGNGNLNSFMVLRL